MTLLRLPLLLSIQRILIAALLLCSLGAVALAEPGESRVPIFGNEGSDFSVPGKQDNVVHGWLPTGWNDNSEWAPVSATYTKLSDSPDKAAGAVRIKIDKMEDGQLQLTTYQGSQKYKQGVTYRVAGWLRSPDNVPVYLGMRQMGDPYEFFHEQEVGTVTTWKPFEFLFTPTKDIEAIFMLAVREIATLDVAGLSVTQKP